MGEQIKSRAHIAQEGARAAQNRIPEDKNPNPDGSQAHAIWQDAHKNWEKFPDAAGRQYQAV